MRRTMISVLASGAVVAALLTPMAQASPAASSPPTAQLSGADCEWGTEPASVIPTVDYPRGYLNGVDWRRDHDSPYECAIGAAWTPLMHSFPISHVQVTSEEFGVEWADQRQCTSLDDPNCLPGAWAEMYAESALGFCDEASDFNCVEGLEVIGPDGSTQAARFVRGFPEVPEVPEYRKDGLFHPAGGSVPLWEYDAPGGTARVLTMGKVESVFRVQGSRWEMATPSSLFRFVIRPVTIESRPGIPKPAFFEYVDPDTGANRIGQGGWEHPSAVGCAAIETDECAMDTDFPDGYRYRLTLRLRDAASMYLNGAVDGPVAYSEKVTGGHRFVLEAGPSPVLGMAGWIPKSQVPRSLVDQTFADLGFNYNWEIDFEAASYKSLGRGGRDSLAWMKALLPYFGDRASFISDAWYVENTPPIPGRPIEPCLIDGTGEFVGIVSSNATAYTGDPPTYNPVTSTLSYEIAGPHYMPDGTTLSRGRYAINMNAAYVKCLLGVDKVPSVARVELIYPDGEASAATLALKQDKNWLRLTYENFTFSSPTVSVKFPKSLTCVKGKGKKKKTKAVVAFSCPKGWKPKR